MPWRTSGARARGRRAMRRTPTARPAPGRPTIDPRRDVDAGLADRRRARSRAARSRARAQRRRPGRAAAARSPIHTPGQRADEDVGHQAEVDVADEQVREAGDPQQQRGVEDVGADDAVRREAEDHDQREADRARPADRGHAEHEAEHERRCATARDLVPRASSGTRVALARRRRGTARAPRTATADDAAARAATTESSVVSKPSP